MDRAFSVLPKVLQKRGLQTHATASLVTFRSQEWLNERFLAMGKLCTVKEFSEGVLLIECAHSIALQECQAAIPDLKQYLSAECAFARVVDVRVVRI